MAECAPERAGTSAASGGGHRRGGRRRRHLGNWGWWRRRRWRGPGRQRGERCRRRVRRRRRGGQQGRIDRHGRRFGPGRLRRRGWNRWGWRDLPDDRQGRRGRWRDRLRAARNRQLPARRPAVPDQVVRLDGQRRLSCHRRRVDDVVRRLGSRVRLDHRRRPCVVLSREADAAALPSRHRGHRSSQPAHLLEVAADAAAQRTPVAGCENTADVVPRSRRSRPGWNEPAGHPDASRGRQLRRRRPTRCRLSTDPQSLSAPALIQEATNAMSAAESLVFPLGIAPLEMFV